MKRNNVFFILTISIVILLSAFWSSTKNRNVASQNIFGGAEVGLTELQKDFVQKIREGNMPGLVEYFDEEVSLTLFKESDFYTTEEAENILLTFCQNHTAKKFLVKHFGVNNAKTNYYLIGEMTTTTKEKLRVYISNNETKIESIEITVPREL